MGKSLNQAKANAIRYTKKKVEHWQLVSLALAGYDAISMSYFRYSYFGVYVCTTVSGDLQAIVS